MLQIVRERNVTMAVKVIQLSEGKESAIKKRFRLGRQNRTSQRTENFWHSVGIGNKSVLEEAKGTITFIKYHQQN